MSTAIRVAQSVAEAVAWYTATLAADQAVLLETLKVDEDNHVIHLFSNPVEVLQAYSAAEVQAVLQVVEERLQEGCYVAGYMTYEAGYAFEGRLQELMTEAESQQAKPVSWFGVFTQATQIDLCQIDEAEFRAQVDNWYRELGEFSVSNMEFGLAEAEYVQKVKTVQQHIRAGTTYQINLTFPLQFTLQGEALALYGQLRQKQRVGYAAFIKNSQQTLLSLSPELFFRRDKQHIVVKPMKGTVKRGRTMAEDALQSEWLRNSPKNQAENAMIVDLLRNDLGRVSETGSVQVARLFEIERYETLFQMTSTVESQLQQGTDYIDLFRQLFPSGSITGAPKISSMELIHKLESEARGVYTGCIGFMAPGGQAAFNIPIRTVEVVGQCGKMGIGSGITWDSDAVEEYRECCLKSRFLTEPVREFQLIETLLVAEGTYRLLDLHLARLGDSAGYFGFTWRPDAILTAAMQQLQELDLQAKYKVRLLLDRYGQVTLESVRLPEQRSDSSMSVVAIAGTSTHSEDVFLYHKTTQRQLYDTKYREAVAAGLYDYLFLNERGELTEGCIGNLFIKKQGCWLTPPLTSGLLNGIMRQQLLQTLPQVQEAILCPQDLQQAEEIYHCNAVRGLVRVHFAAKTK